MDTFERYEPLRGERIRKSIQTFFSQYQVEIAQRSAKDAERAIAKWCIPCGNDSNALSILPWLDQAA
jgi:hypothetical protein